MKEKVFLQGRCVHIGPDFLAIQNLKGIHKVPCSESLILESKIRIGDVCEWRNDPQNLKILTPNRSENFSSKWMERILSPKRLHGTKIRAQVEAGIREFFLDRGFFETRTPLLVPSPGMEPHIRPYEVVEPSQGRKSAGFLPTSPEFAMKRLLVGGLEKIFQICPAFRHEPESKTHQPEFTMLEWYRAYSGFEKIMKDTEEMIEFLALKIHGRPVIPFQGRDIRVKTPWKRFKIRELFQEIVGVDLVKCHTTELLLEEAKRLGVHLDLNSQKMTWDDLYFKIWMDHIEPSLPEDEAVFVSHYPPSQAALSVLEKDPNDGTTWAKRFELYAGGLELGNAFEELTNPIEQRKRFTEDMNLREEIYGKEFPKSPLDESFLDALSEGMPPSGGIAVGVDRLIMLLADENEIANTLWITPQELRL